MPGTAMDGFLRQLRTLVAGQKAAGQTDQYLLEQFLLQRDEEAFAALLERHGPMVLAVCRRVLKDEHLAEEAFQATFLVLARQASSIRKRASIGSWLHGAALRLAQNAKRETARSKRRDERNTSQAALDPQADASWREAQAILDDELQRLPENYRLPLILCYLEGLTRDEAAAQLGWAPGKLRGLLERGRERLRSRLVRRGVTLSAAGSATLLADTVLAATVPPLLAVTTLRAAGRFAVGTTLTACGISGPVVALTQGGLKMAASKKIIVIAALVLFSAIIGSGAGILAQWTEPVDVKPANVLPVLPVVQETVNSPEPKEVRVDRLGDPLPEGVVARLGTMRFRHANPLHSLVYTPDGKNLVSACWDGAGRIWDAATGKITRSFPLGRFPHVAVTPDGKTLVTVESGAILRVWDLASGIERRHMKDSRGYALALSPDGKIAALGQGEGDKKRQLSLWDLETGLQIRTLGASDRFVGALAFSRTGKLLAAGDGYPIERDEKGPASSVRLWDATSGRQLHELKGHTGGITAVAFSPVGKFVASASYDGTIRLWNEDGRLVRSISVPEKRISEIDLFNRRGKGIDCGGVLAIAFSPNGRWIASGGYDGGVRLWDAGTGKGLRTMAGHRGGVASVVFSPDGKVLASGGYDHTIRLWDAVTGKDHQPQRGHDGPLREIAVSPDGKSAAVTCNGTIHLWSLDRGEKLHELRGHTGGIYHVAYSPDGRNLASTSDDETVRIWDVAQGREVRQFLGHGSTSDVAFTPVDNMLLSGGSYGSLRFWDWTTPKMLRQIKTEGISQMSISRDGRVVGAIWDQGTVWDVASGKELRRIPGRCHLAVAPAGGTFVTQAKDGIIHLWSIATGEELTAFPGPTYSPTWPGGAVLVFSPDCRLLAMRQGTGIGLWEMATGKVRRHITGHDGGVVPFVFSPDGRTMLTGGEDTTVLIWDLTRRHEARPARLAPADLDALWRDLGGDDAERADRSICTLAARADQSVPFLKHHLRPIAAPDPQRLTALIADLDNGAFAVREKAAQELQRLRELATPALKDVIAKKGSLETRRRIEELLAKQRSPLTAGESLQFLRAVEVLERIDGIEARKLLQRVATGAPQARLTQEARDALRRLDGRIAK